MIAIMWSRAKGKAKIPIRAWSSRVALPAADIADDILRCRARVAVRVRGL